MAESIPIESAFGGDSNGVRRPPVSLVVNLYPSENDLGLEQEDLAAPLCE